VGGEGEMGGGGFWRGAVGGRERVVEEGRRLVLIWLLCLMRMEAGASGLSGWPLLLFIVVGQASIWSQLPQGDDRSEA